MKFLAVCGAFLYFISLSSAQAGLLEILPGQWTAEDKIEVVAQYPEAPIFPRAPTAGPQTYTYELMFQRSKRHYTHYADNYGPRCGDPISINKIQAMKDGVTIQLPQGNSLGSDSTKVQTQVMPQKKLISKKKLLLEISEDLTYRMISLVNYVRVDSGSEFLCTESDQGVYFEDRFNLQDNTYKDFSDKYSQKFEIINDDKMRVIVTYSE